MKALFGLLILLAFISCQEDSLIVELTDAGFAKFIASHNAVMVEFYSPGCSNCKAFAPEYELAAKKIREDLKPYVLARLDVNRHPDTADMYQVTKLPSLALFLGARPQGYYDEREAKALIRFLDPAYKIAFPSTPLEKAEEITERFKAKGAQSILISDDAATIDLYKRIAKNNEEVTFFHTAYKTGLEVFPEVKATTALVMLKSFDEKKVIYEGKMTQHDIETFIKVNSRPKVMEFDQQTIGHIFHRSGYKGVVLLCEASKSAAIIEEFKKFASDNSALDLLFIVSDIKEGLGSRVAKMLKLTSANLPALEILETKDKLERNTFSGKFVASEMASFLTEWRKKGAAKTDL